MSRNADLEAAILENRDAREPYEVYADWLLREGDSHGELIHVQLGLETHPSPELLAREAELLREHGIAGGEIEARWRRGFLDRVAIRGGYQDELAADTYRQVAALPSAALLRELELGVGVFHYSWDAPDDLSLLDALREMPLPIQKLRFAAHDNQLSWTRMGALARAELHAVEELELECGRFAIGAVDMPRLRSLTLVTGGMPAHV
ncbi:MAG TPA: hypothetical protein VGC41_27295, partial [Kofleriaceae bacterium]